MLTNRVPKMRLLLIKSEGQFKHSGKYYLQNGRWHKLHDDKPVPKGAAVAAHPHAAGVPSAGKATYTDEQWEQLKLPAENSNASTFNKQIDQLKAAADAGDLTGILGSGYGINTYGKKLAIIANHVLALLGSTHTVTPGQKPGAHAAVQTAPQIEAGQPAPVEPAPEPKKPDVTISDEGKTPAAADAGPKEGETKQGADGTLVFKDGRWHKQGQTAGQPPQKPKLKGQNYDAEIVSDALAEKDEQAIQNVIGAYEGDAPNADEKAVLDYAKQALAFLQGNAATTALTMPTFDGGTVGQSVIDYYEKVAQKVIDMAAVGDAAGLEAMKSEGLKPNSKGKIGNTWAGKTPNSKMLLALHAQALEHAKGGAAAPSAGAKDEAIQSAVDHLKEDAKQGDLPAAEKKEDAELVQKLESAQSPAQKGDVFELDSQYEKMNAGKWTVYNVSPDGALIYMHKVGAKVPNQSNSATIPVETLKEAISKGTAKKLEAAQGKPAEQFEVTASGYLAGKGGYIQQYANLKQANAKAEQMKVAGYDVHVTASHPFKIVVNSKPAATPDAAPIKKEPRLVLPKKSREAAPAAPAPAGKLDAIPWDSQLLPDSNANAKSHNKQVEKIKAMAYAGDVAGLEAFKAGKNTYGKKQNLLAQTALAALKEGGAPAAATSPETEPAAKPTGSHDQYGIFSSLTDDIDDAVGNGDASTLKDIESYLNTPANQKEKGVDAIKQYLEKAKAAMASGGPQEDGPKEGDTKQGADGMLVLKDGHWVKVNDDTPAAQAKKLTKEEKAAAVKAAVEAIQIPDFTGVDPHSNAAYYGPMAEKIKKAALEEGMAGFKKFVTIGADGSFASKKATTGMKTNKCFETDKLPRRQLFWKFCSEMKAALESQKGAAKPSKPTTAAEPAPAAASAPAIEAMDDWQQTGPQGGSNPGGRFKDPDGVEWYCKFPADEDTAKAEVLAARLYAALGVTGQDAKLIIKGGKVGIASRWTTVSKASSPAALAQTDGVAAGFGADAWLANWDVVGLGYDNLQIGADGKAVRVDAGGSLMYRAQGGKKAFGSSVTEIDSLRDPKINPQAAAVFGGMTDADITASVAKVINLPDASIRALCFQHGPGDEAARKALADTLISRKADLAAKFPKAGKAKKKRLDPNNLPVDADQLPKRHDFSNWNGPGKGLSSQPHVNAANNAVEQEILELAKTGNLNKLKDFHFHEIDKTTGNATGKMLPIKNHPSKHVVQFHADVVQLLDEIANPPEPLKHFIEAEVGTLEALAAAFPPKPFGTTVDSVKSNEKLGFWVVLGGTSGVAKFKPKKVMDYTKAAIDAAYQKYQDAKPLAKHFINSVQASGSYNDLFRNGKEADGHGNKLTDVAQAALEQATSMPEGTSLYRWQNMSDDMVKKIMSAPDGTVFQATGPMCTSYSPTATSGFGQHRVVIRYASGAKAVESFGSTNFKGEKEVTTLPNSRFVILSKKMVPNEKNPGKQRLELEVLMLPPDLGIAA